ncbi:excinuclease ABC subunit UvrC [Hoeflea sp. WL0058]|uniref:UvrABC system protein C n=1 Tax=Flavimaribacter sediminis TaxID=2865987 RepID=A0AAE3D3C8_9HYPH|nr:excinuclease ABC subunit UvrC [Flavimaribacter sediminis]MBW8639651.1 excinuclease ABC subunit UvrC [Flavimaribacter sediminis]
MTPEEDTAAESGPNEQISDEPAINATTWEGAGALASDLAGPERIQEFVKILPNAPGVYRMLNGDGDILYVGKARSLKKRVSNYAQGRGHTNRISSMVRDTANMEFITTRTETEALLLEANLIKRFKPRYNVLLRDDKSFPYILLTGDHEAAGIYKHRGARSRQGSYFGPFASAQAVDRTINALQRAFLIRTCTNAMYETRTRPCLLYQIKRCSAPCTGEIDLESYRKLVDEATDFLSGKSQKVKGTLGEAMQQASEELDFERAAVYRDRLAALSHVQSHQGINPQTVEEADVFAIHQDGGLNCIQVFFFRTGQNWGNRAYFPKADPALPMEEVLGAFLAQFYDDKPCPKQILVSHAIPESDLLVEALSMRAGRKVSISVPHRGEKRDLVQQVATNAREAHGRRLSETSTQGNLLKAMASTFGLARPPSRIEVYDNSHIMGANAVGGMIVAGAEGFAKNQYRKFNIKSEEITPGDDFGMMREVLHRRIARLIKEHERPQTKDADDDSHDVAEIPAWPDVLLIDGGQGQLSAVQGILEELGVSDEITAIGVAKGVDREAGRERFFMKGRQAFSLPPRDPVLYFIQRMRDEAHRYAIGAHRARRSKEITRNPLDEIAGIGPARKRSLLHHFGTAKAVSRAGVEDLVAVEGISQATAQMIYDHFHEDRRN